VDDIDANLYSTEKMMTVMITGQPDTLNMLVQRFLEVNGHDIGLIEGRRLMYETYHLAYSIKIALKYVLCLLSPGVLLISCLQQFPRIRNDVSKPASSFCEGCGC
jgi:hypothetical protein